MGKKINDTSEFPATTPATNDRVLGVDVSDTSNDANGETVTFTVEALRNASAYATAAQGALADSATQPGDNISTLTNDSGYTTATGTVDTSGTPVALDFARFTDASTIEGRSYSEVRTDLGLVIGTNVLAYDANLQSFVTAFTLPTSDGTADQVLKTDGAGNIGFATPGGGGGLVPISKTTAANDAAIDIALTGGYSAYELRIKGLLPVTDGTTLYLRTSTDGGSSFDSGAGNYGYNYVKASTTSVVSAGANSATEIQMANQVGNVTGEEVCMVIRIEVSDGTNQTQITTRGQYDTQFNNQTTLWGSGQRSDTTAVDAIRILMSSGNISVGEFHLYGIADGA